MTKFLITTAVILFPSFVVAKDLFYPEVACKEILSSEYSTGNGDTAVEQFEILCRSDEGRYTVFIVSWTSVSGFFGLGRVAHETQINLIPYNGTVLIVK